MSFFDKFRAGLAKTAQQIRERLGEFAGETPADEPAKPAATSTGGRRAVAVESIEALEDALVGADVGLAATEKIIDAVREERGGTLAVRAARVIERVLTDVPAPPSTDVTPYVILVVGVNGTGKTTSVGKLARYYRDTGRSVMISAADTYRAAAIEQLSVWAQRAGVDIVRASMGSDPAAVTFDAIQSASVRRAATS